MSDTPIYNNSTALENRDAVDGRLFSPSAGRNKGVIADNLAALLPANAKILEIASGTGEHGAELLSRRSDIIWQYSDVDPDLSASQSAWATQSEQLLPPLNIDTTHAWTRELGDFNAIFCANMIHIAPLSALEGLVAGAPDVLKPEGYVWLYGPFQEGEQTAEGNLRFDADLKRRNPAWGVRDLDHVKHIFAKAGLSFETRRDMPKNNLLLGFRH